MDPNQSTQQPTSPLSPSMPVDQTPALQKTNNKLTGIIIIVLGILEAIFMGIMLFVVMPQMDVLYKNLNVNSSLPTTLVWILEIIFVIQIILGLALLMKKTDKIKNILSKLGIIVAILGILGLLFTLPKILTSTISPVYNLTNTPVEKQITPIISPTIDPTADWETLTSRICHISLKYPKNWNGKMVEGNGCAFEIKNPNVKNSIFFLNTLAPNVSWDSIINENKEGKDTLIAGREGLITKPMIDKTGGIYGIYFHSQNFVYSIYYFIPGNDNTTEAIYNKIISSIKFLDQNNETADWKTYKSNYFSVQYPYSWEVKDSKNPNFKTELTNIQFNNRIPSEKIDIEIHVIVRTSTLKREFSVGTFNNKEKITIDDISGFKSSGYGGEAGGVYKTLIELKEGNIEYYILVNNYSNTNFKEFDTFLSTFKFTQ